MNKKYEESEEEFEKEVKASEDTLSFEELEEMYNRDDD